MRLNKDCEHSCEGADETERRQSKARSLALRIMLVLLTLSAFIVPIFAIADSTCSSVKIAKSRT